MSPPSTLDPPLTLSVLKLSGAVGRTLQRAPYKFCGITPCAIKSATLFPIITPAFLGRFLYFCTNSNRKEYSTIYLFNGLMTSSIASHFTSQNFTSVILKIKYAEFEDSGPNCVRPLSLCNYYYYYYYYYYYKKIFHPW